MEIRGDEFRCADFQWLGVHFHCWGLSSIPGQGAQILQAAQPTNQSINSIDPKEEKPWETLTPRKRKRQRAASAGQEEWSDRVCGVRAALHPPPQVLQRCAPSFAEQCEQHFCKI